MLKNKQSNALSSLFCVRGVLSFFLSTISFFPVYSASSKNKNVIIHHYSHIFISILTTW